MSLYPSTSSPLSSSSPVTASLVSAVPVPTYGSGGNFSILAKTTISAPPLEALSLIRDTKRWGEWNSFCPKCIVKPRAAKGKESDEANGKGGSEDEDGKWLEGEELDGWLKVGTEMTFDTFLNGDGLVEGRKRSRTTTVVVTRIEKMSGSLDPSPREEVDGKPGKGYRIAWKNLDYAHWQLRSERVMEFVEVQMDDGKIRTRYACW